MYHIIDDLKVDSIDGLFEALRMRIRKIVKARIATSSIFLLIAASFLSLAFSPPCLAQTTNTNVAGKFFLRTASYGLIAGGLLGAASLAFTAEPGNNLNNIFRGASLGLYAGMIYGAYRIYTANDEAYAVIPLITSQGKLVGVHMQSLFWRF